MIFLFQKNIPLITGILLICLILFTGGCGDDTTSSPATPLPTATTINADTFVKTLENDGFIVQEGAFVRTNLIEACEKGEAPNCNANNYNTPYFTCSVPKSPGQTADDYALDDNGLGRAFRMRADEAVVVIGNTPPEMLFFNYPLFLHSRQNNFYATEDITGSSVYPVVVGSGENARRILFGGLGDTINISTISTEGTPGGAPGYPYNQRFIIIVTPDKNTDSLIRNSAIKTGYPEIILNTMVVSSSLVKLGITQDADTISFANRNAMFIDEQACQNYINNPTVRVFRVTPSVQNELNPFETPLLKPRGTGVTEMDYLPALNDLRTAILETYKDYNAEEVETDIWLNESYEAIQMGLDNLGESRDTSYLGTKNDPNTVPPLTLPDDPNTFFIVYGVNHVKTNKCTYSNFVVYGAEEINGVIGVDNREFTGSAADYIPDHPQADYLYAWKVSRDANGDPHCVEVPFPAHSNDFHGIDGQSHIFIGFRAYLEQETEVGPAWQELVYDRVIKFSK